MSKSPRIMSVNYHISNEKTVLLTSNGRPSNSPDDDPWEGMAHSRVGDLGLKSRRILAESFDCIRSVCHKPKLRDDWELWQPNRSEKQGPDQLQVWNECCWLTMRGVMLD